MRRVRVCLSGPREVLRRLSRGLCSGDLSDAVRISMRESVPRRSRRAKVGDNRNAASKELVEQGKHEEALEVAQAIVTLMPRATDAWRVIHSAAQALGRADLAAEAAARCISARCAEGPSPVPNVSWGQA